MSSDGQPLIEPQDLSGLKTTIVYAQWHPEIISALVANAKAELRRWNITAVQEILAPGSFELPLLAQSAAESDVDIVLTFGVIIRGETPHFEYVSQAATHGILQASLKTGKPIGFGVLTVDTLAQAQDRSGLPGSIENKGQQTVQAALQTYVSQKIIHS